MPSIEQTQPGSAPDEAAVSGASTAQEVQQSSTVQSLLEQLCAITPADQGGLFRVADGASERVDVLAAYPPLINGRATPAWLAAAAHTAKTAIDERATVELPRAALPTTLAETLSDDAAMVATPISVDGSQSPVVAAAFLVRAPDDAERARQRSRIELVSGLLTLFELRAVARQSRNATQRMEQAMALISAVQEHSRFAAIAMAFVNEVATRLQAERVSLGFVRGRFARLTALSGTEKFARKTQLAQDIESAMEECIDQDVEVMYPNDSQQPVVTREAQELSDKHGPMHIIAAPLRDKGAPVGALLVERAMDKPWSQDEVDMLRLSLDLASPRLVELRERDKWFGARLAAGARTALAKVVGPEHTWIKIAAALGFAVIVFLALAKGAYRVGADFVVEAAVLQVAPAPFDGFLESVHVEVGDEVVADETVLATLDTAQLRLQLAALRAGQAGYEKQAATHRRDGEVAESQMALAQADEAQAQMDLIEAQIAQARIVSHISGVVITGDLKRMLGSPVKTGDALFEVAPLDTLETILQAPEDQIADVQVGADCALAPAADPASRAKCVVTHIEPIAQVVEGKNVFRVRARLNGDVDWLRPGMEGVAKIDAGRRNYLSIWLRPIANWVRMRLWL